MPKIASQKYAKYFQPIYNYIGYDKKIKIVDFDFQKPWWDIMYKFKLGLGTEIFSSLVQVVFFSLFSFFIGQIFATRDINFLFILLFVWLGVYLIIFFVKPFYILAQGSISHNIIYHSHKLMQFVDPIFHTSRSSGQILSKINRVSLDYFRFLDLINRDIIPFIIRAISLTILLASFDLVLGLLSGFFLILSVVVGLVLRLVSSYIFQPFQIKTEDKSTAVNVESLAQVALIRSTFATDGQLKKIRSLSSKKHSVWGTKWRVNNFNLLASRVILVLGFGVLGSYTFYLLDTGGIDTIVAISLLLAYSIGFRDAQFIGKSVQQIIELVINIRDGFEFFRNYGEQTFPVLDGDGERI